MKKLFAFTLTLFCLSNLSAQNYEQIKNQLTEIFEQNLKLRAGVMPIVQKYGFESPQMDSLNNQILAYDSMALSEVTTIIDTYGWLGISEIGITPNSALFVTIQHALDDAIRKKYFPLLRASAEQGESSMADMATMQDRILINDGKAQIYGTQYQLVDNQKEYFPIQDIKNVNKRRRKVGLKKIKF